MLKTLWAVENGSWRIPWWGRQDVRDKKTGEYEEAVENSMRLYGGTEIKNDWIKTCFENQIAGRYNLHLPKENNAKTCFVENTPIWTLQGIRAVQDVRKHDMVLTHEGRFRKVACLYKNPIGTRKLYELYIATGDYIATATNDHSFFVYDTMTKAMKWKRLDQLTKKDFLMRGFLASPNVAGNNENDMNMIHEFARRNPRLTGFLMAGGEATSSFLDAPIPHDRMTEYRNLVSAANMQGMSVQAGVLHVSDQDLIHSLMHHDTRMSVWRWALCNKAAELAWGWHDFFLENNLQDVSYDPLEADLISILMNCLSEGEETFFSCHGRLILKEEKETMGCACLVRRGKTKLTYMNKHFVRFGWTRRREADDPFVYTLNVEDDHSFVVNGFMAQNCHRACDLVHGVSGGTNVLRGDLTTTPISLIKEGDEVMDKHGHTTKVVSKCSHHYQGNVLCMGKISATSNMDDDPQCAGRLIFSKKVSFHNEEASMTEMQMPILRFIIRFFYEWDVREDDDHHWVSWDMSIMDDIMIRESILPMFWGFDFSIHDEDRRIRFKKQSLESFLSNMVPLLPTMSNDKIVFLEAQTRRPIKNHLFPTLEPYVTITRAISGQLTTMDMTREPNREDEIYHLTTGSGSYITEMGVIDGEGSIFLSGDARVMTPFGSCTIAEAAQADQLLVWGGSSFAVLDIEKAGWMDVIKIELSHGVFLQCTLNTFIPILREQRVEMVAARDLQQGDCFPWYAPPVPASHNIPSGVRLSLEWIHNKSGFFDNMVIIRDNDQESLVDLLTDMMFCGLRGKIIYHAPNGGHVLRLEKDKWSMLQQILSSKNAPWAQPVDGLSVVRTSAAGKTADMFRVKGPVVAQGVMVGPSACFPSATINVRPSDTPESLRTSSYEMVRDLNRFYDLGNERDTNRPIVANALLHGPIDNLTSKLETIYEGMMTSSRDWNGTRRFAASKENSAPFVSHELMESIRVAGMCNGSIRLTRSEK